MPVLRQQVEQILESAKVQENLCQNADLKEEQTIALGHSDDPFASPTRAHESKDQEKKETLQAKPAAATELFEMPAFGTKLGSTSAFLDQDDKQPHKDEHRSPIPLPVRIR